MVLVHAFKYMESIWGIQWTCWGVPDIRRQKEKMDDDVEQKTGNIVKTGQQQYNKPK